MQRLKEQLGGIGIWIRRQWRENPLGTILTAVAFIVLAAIVIETARQGNTGFEDKTLWHWLELLLVPLALGLGGSILAIHLTRSVEARQRREDLTVTVYNQYLARYRDFAQINYLIEDVQESELRDVDMLDIKDFGNWLDLLATLANQGLINTDLIEQWQLDQMIVDFYDGTARFDFLKNARLGEGWRNMREYVQRRHGRGK